LRKRRLALGAAASLMLYWPAHGIGLLMQEKLAC
jgi:hypothetical protein